MGIYTPYGVPRRVKDTIDQMDTGQLGDLTVELEIPTPDMPSSDLYDWLRQRIFDWLYDPDWKPPTDEQVTQQQRDEAEIAVADARRRLAEAEAYERRVKGE